MGAAEKPGCPAGWAPPLGTLGAPRVGAGGAAGSHFPHGEAVGAAALGAPEPARGGCPGQIVTTEHKRK